MFSCERIAAQFLTFVPSFLNPLVRTNSLYGKRTDGERVRFAREALTLLLFYSKPRRCASRDSINQNVSFVEWFSCLEEAVFRGICGEIVALFQACVGNFDTILLWKVVGTFYLDSSQVTFKYFAFLSFCDTFELLGHVQAAMMIWVLFLPFFLDSLLVTVSSFIELFWPSCYFNLSSLQISGSTRVYPC